MPTAAQQSKCPCFNHQRVSLYVVVIVNFTLPCFSSHTCGQFGHARQTKTKYGESCFSGAGKVITTKSAGALSCTIGSRLHQGLSSFVSTDLHQPETAAYNQTIRFLDFECEITPTVQFLAHATSKTKKKPRPPKIETKSTCLLNDTQGGSHQQQLGFLGRPRLHLNIHQIACIQAELARAPFALYGQDARVRSNSAT